MSGARHAFDANHIAAIDNVTRKMVGQRRPSLTVGLYFSLGHSAVVALACAAMALASTTVLAGISAFRDVGDVLGTILSATCLLLIAAGNAGSFFAPVAPEEATARQLTVKSR